MVCIPFGSGRFGGRGATPAKADCAMTTRFAHVRAGPAVDGVPLRE